MCVWESERARESERERERERERVFVCVHPGYCGNTEMERIPK